MRYIVSGKEMKLLDKNTSDFYKVPELVLMEQAALGFVQGLSSLSITGKGIVFCGIGNNGADGLAIARLLIEKDYDIDICLVKEVWNLSDQTSTSYETQKTICESYGYRFISDTHQIFENEYDFVIDAVFGVGLSRNITQKYVEIIDTINRINAICIAVDIPSGINADNGNVMGCAVKCDHTITFAFDKLGLELWPGNEYAGEILIANIGITNKSWLEQNPSFAYLETEDIVSLPKRPKHSNKGTFGKLLIVAGGDDMPGAAIMSAKAAYCNGVGLVKIYTSESNRTTIQSVLPEVIIKTYQGQIAAEDVTRELEWADAVVIGPGLGMSDNAYTLVKRVISECKVPLVIDADALNILSKNNEWMLYNHTDWVITPHLGEFSRLSKLSIEHIQNNLTEVALDYAKRFNCIYVLKDFHTVVANPHGLSYLNLSGNNGMATAGSGDVLTGIIGSFLAQGMPSIEAASYGVFLHGMAGDVACENMGMRSIMASDIIDGLKEVWNKMENK